MNQYLTVCLLTTLFACGEPRSTGDNALNAPADSIVSPLKDAMPTDGPVEILGADGKSRSVGNMRDGKRHGTWTAYFPDGTLQSRNSYLDGVLHGAMVVFHPNGQLYFSGEYRHGKQVGEWKFLDMIGEVVKTVDYDSTGSVINDR